MYPLFVSLAAAVGALFGYANPWYQFPAAALALPAAVLLLGLAAPTARLAFKYAWMAGTLASFACLYWIFWPVAYYGEIHWAFALPMPVLLSMAMGCYYGLLGLAARHSNRLSPLLATLFLGIAWTVMEIAQASLLSGFSWLTLSSAFVRWPLVVQAASLVGAYGVSGLLAAAMAGVILCSRSRICAIVPLAVYLGLVSFGWTRIADYAETTPARTVAVVQGNIDQGLKWDPEYQQNTVEKYLRLSREVSASNPELIVWPETSMPFYFQDPTPLRLPIMEFARTGRSALLLGAPAYERTGGGGSFVLYNRAFLIPTGLSTGVSSYDKEHLVPFGEYMPLASILPVQKLVTGIGDFVPGKNNLTLKAGDLALGMLVCYEAIFADLAQNRVSQGANLLVNISNDAWFGSTSAPHQHLQLSALRAIEQGRYIVRSTNTGLSAFIDPLGRIRMAGPQFAEFGAAGVVHPRTEMTVFHRFYSELLIALGVFAALFGFLIIRGGGDSAATSGLQ